MGGTPTLPADFFTKKKGKAAPVAAPPSGAPPTLPADFFSAKGKNAPSPTPKPTQAPTPAAAAPKPSSTPTSTPDTNQILAKALGWRPRWDDPNAILQDPHWLGRTARYAGGEYIGESKALAGLGVGGAKLLYDIFKLSAPMPFSIKEAQDIPLSHKGEQAGEVWKDIKGAGKGLFGLASDLEELGGGKKNVGKLTDSLSRVISSGGLSGAPDLAEATWDLIRHFPEAAKDPEKFGQTVLNTALTVDGAVKFAAKAAPLFKGDPLEAGRVANNGSNQAASRFFKKKVFQDQYVHAKGLEVAKKITKAAASIHEEIKTHASGIATQIDTKLPSGVIDAGAEAKVISDTFKDVVKTPDKAHPVLIQMVKDAQQPPGMWSWEKARQFRSSVGRAMGRVEGPQKAVLTQVYKDLTAKLGSTAKQYGLENSWNHYNELERKTSRQFGDFIDDIKGAQSGREVAARLGKDSGLTNETVRNLSKYGLDPKEVSKFVRDATRIAKGQKGWKGTLFRMAYGTPAGVPVMLAARIAGLPWIASVGAGAAVGYAATGLVDMVRALRLSPDVIEHVLSQREIPGRMPVDVGRFPGTGLELPPPSEPTSGPAAPVPTPPSVPPSPQAPPSPPAPGAPPTPTTASSLPPSEVKAMTPYIKSHQERLESLNKTINDPKASEAARTGAENQMREMLQGTRRKVDVGPPLGKAERRVAPTSASRWYTDKGSIPGEPRAYLDSTPDNLDSAKAVIIEHESPKGTKYEALGNDGKSLGTFDHFIQAQQAAEKAFPSVKKAPAEAVGREPGSRAGTTKESRLGRATKARERVAKVRSTAKRSKEQEIAEAQARAQTPNFSVANLGIPEMEEALKGLNPNALSGLQKLRRAKSIPDEGYTEALKYYLLEAYEKRGGNKAAD